MRSTTFITQPFLTMMMKFVLLYSTDEIVAMIAMINIIYRAVMVNAMDACMSAMNSACEEGRVYCYS